MCLIIEPNDLSFGLEVSRQAKHKKLQLLQGLNYSFIKKNMATTMSKVQGQVLRILR